jgi:hypothetical protein
LLGKTVDLRRLLTEAITSELGSGEEKELLEGGNDHNHGCSNRSRAELAAASLTRDLFEPSSIPTMPISRSSESRSVIPIIPMWRECRGLHARGLRGV